MKNELKNFTYVGPNGRQTYNYICLYEVRSTQTENRSCIIDATQWQRCSNITRRKWG